MKEMGNLAHDECYAADKTTQKSGYGELTNIPSPLEEEGQGEGEEIKHRPEQCENHKEDYVVNKSFARHPIPCLIGREKKEKLMGKGYI